MEGNINGNLDNGNFANFFGDGSGRGIPGNSEAFGTLDPSLDFGTPWNTHDMNGQALNNSLLNQGFESACNPFDGAKWETLQGNLDGSEIAELVTDQTNAVASSLGQHSIFSPIPSNDTSINITPNSISTHLPRQYITRPHSLLRNEYLPEFASNTQSSIMASHNHNHGQRHHFTSPSNYVLRAAPGQLTSQGIRPAFNESNVRSSAQNDNNYDLIHQLGYRPTTYINQSPLQSTYYDPQRYAQRSSDQSAYGLPPRCRSDYETSQSYVSRNGQPSTPPNLIASYERNGQSSSGISAPNARSVSIKREPSPSPLPAPKAKPRKKVGRKTVKQTIEIDDDGLSFTKSDAEYTEELMDAMNDGTEAEDNPGMQSTWTRIRDKKGGKIREKCVEMLNLLKHAQREQLGDKKAVNPYPNFDHRLEEACAALRTQKTICKHLMEPPYTHTVANDPTYAAQRVRNNRRVNGQKKQAINMGRQALGIQGQGKGRSMKHIDPSPTEECFFDGESSEENPFADEDELTSDPEPPVKRQRSSRKNSKVQRTKSDEDYEDSAYRTPAQRAKRSRRSAHKIVYDGPAADTPGPSQSSNRRVSITSSSPIPQLEPITHHHGSHYSDYPIEHVYGSSSLSLPSPRSMLPEFWSGPQQYGTQSDQFTHQPTRYPSSSQLNSSDQLHGGNDAGIHGLGLELKPLSHQESSN